MKHIKSQNQSACYNLVHFIQPYWTSFKKLYQFMNICVFHLYFFPTYLFLRGVQLSFFCLLCLQFTTSKKNHLNIYHIVKNRKVYIIADVVKDTSSRIFFLVLFSPMIKRVSPPYPPRKKKSKNFWFLLNY